MKCVKDFKQQNAEIEVANILNEARPNYFYPQYNPYSD